MRAPVRPLVPPNARETCREARCEACVRLSLACSLLPDDHESIQGFVARDLKALKGKDRPCHQLLFSDGAQVPLYVDRHEKATPPTRRTSSSAPPRSTSSRRPTAPDLLPPCSLTPVFINTTHAHA